MICTTLDPAWVDCTILLLADVGSDDFPWLGMGVGAEKALWGLGAWDGLVCPLRALTQSFSPLPS